MGLPLRYNTLLAEPCTSLSLAYVGVALGGEIFVVQLFKFWISNEYYLSYVALLSAQPVWRQSDEFSLMAQVSSQNTFDFYQLVTGPTHWAPLCPQQFLRCPTHCHAFDKTRDSTAGCKNPDRLSVIHRCVLLGRLGHIFIQSNRPTHVCRLHFFAICMLFSQWQPRFTTWLDQCNQWRSGLPILTNLTTQSATRKSQSSHAPVYKSGMTAQLCIPTFAHSWLKPPTIPWIPFRAHHKSPASGKSQQSPSLALPWHLFIVDLS